MRILSVDENAGNLYLVETMARTRGHEVVSACNGLEALEQLAAQSFDLIVSDVPMPAMDGFQLCRTVKSDARLKHIPFVFHTATYTARQDEELGLALGASRFLVKPVEPEEFLAAVEEVVRQGESGSISIPVVNLDDDGRNPSLYNQRLVRKLERQIQQLEAARTELAASEEQLSRMWEGSMDGMRLTDRDGIVLRANPALARMFAKPLDGLPGRPFTSCYGVDDPESMLASYREQVESRAVEARFETQLRRWDGQEIWLEGSNAMIETPSGPVVFSILRDATERKRSERERASLEEQLRQAQKVESIGRLAGGIAHDFNNLLTVINGYSRLLLGQLRGDDPLRERVEAIHKAGERAAGLTQQLLAFCRKQVLEPRVLDLNGAIAEMRPMLARLMGEDVELSVRLHPDATTICADPHQLVQVVMNLAVNARDAMPHGGMLSISTTVVDGSEGRAGSHPGVRAGCHVLLAVSDDGIGMNEETRRRIFEPFFTTKEVGKGTGLGLSTIQGVVEQSGGCVEVESEPGRGTTFRIYLPSVDAPADSTQPEAVAAPRGKETVLVVEDQAEVREYAAAALKAYGYRVIEAANPDEALLLCERERGRVDLVLTDVAMPDSSGWDLAIRLGEARPGIKVLFMSGYNDDAIAYRGIAGKGTSFIQKPFGPDQLAVKVREVLAASDRRARILVADDEAGIRKLLRIALEEGGYEVLEAANGIEALKEARAGRVDLAIADMAMPGQEGIETIRALRREVPGVGIVAISGAFQSQFLETAQPLGADAVLCKPVSDELLLASVAEVLKSRGKL